jgi:uncharacterized protein
VALDPFLVEVLACPCDRHAPVTIDETAGRITCTACATVFPIRDSIPVMLLDEAEPGPAGIGGVPEPAPRNSP